MTVSCSLLTSSGYFVTSHITLITKMRNKHIYTYIHFRKSLVCAFLFKWICDHQEHIFLLLHLRVCFINTDRKAMHENMGCFHTGLFMLHLVVLTRFSGSKCSVRWGLLGPVVHRQYITSYPRLRTMETAGQHFGTQYIWCARKEAQTGGLRRNSSAFSRHIHIYLWFI